MVENTPTTNNFCFTLGLIGYPLGHSFSASYFSAKFREEHINGIYKLFPITNINELFNIIKENKNLLGLNVTIPYKQSVFHLMDEFSPEAEAIGAINVIRINKKQNGSCQLKGYNTDWIGFQKSLNNFLTEKTEKALILGTGGASKAVWYALNQLGIKCIFVTRAKDNSDLETNLQSSLIRYDEITQSLIESTRLIVNTTPVGMYPNEDNAPQIPYQWITNKHFCYDLIYNPSITLFMQKCMQQGAKVKNGLEMLHLQADAAWEIWNNPEVRNC